MDYKKCDFCFKDFTRSLRDPSKGLIEIKYCDTDGYTLDDKNRLNRYVVTKKNFLGDMEKSVDICDNCFKKLFSNINKGR